VNKKDFVKTARIYCVLDTQAADYGRLFDILDTSADAGIDIFQIRDKTGVSEEIVSFTRRALQRLNGRQLFIVNDDIDIAIAAGADGVHLGQEDAGISEARQRGGKDFIIGASCQTLRQAMRAEQNGADYIGFGSVFKTQTKPNRPPMDLHVLSDVLKKVSIPVFPIGGITTQNFKTVQDCGAKRVALTRDICLADDVLKVVGEWNRIMDRNFNISGQCVLA